MAGGGAFASLAPSWIGLKLMNHDISDVGNPTLFNPLK